MKIIGIGVSFFEDSGNRLVATVKAAPLDPNAFFHKSLEKSVTGDPPNGSLT